MISVIVPVHNNAHLTVTQLRAAVDRYRHRYDLEWIIVDNASIDQTGQAVAQLDGPVFPHLVYHRLEYNAGFSGGHNFGAAKANGEQLVFLSNDVIIGGDFLSEFQLALQTDPTALVGAELLTHDTGWNRFVELERPVRYLAGWCLACSRETFEAVGCWDDGFGLCDYEDVDLSLRWERAGYKLVEINAPLRHLGGQTAANLDGGRLKQTLKSQAYFCQKHGLTIAKPEVTSADA